MSAKRSHGPTVSVQFQHLIHQPTWNKSSHGKFANIRALPSPPSRLHTGQGDKEPSQTGCASVLPLHLFTRDALGRMSRAEQPTQRFQPFQFAHSLDRFGKSALPTDIPQRG